MKLDENQNKENLASALKAMIADENLEINFVNNIESNFFSLGENLIANRKINLPKLLEVNNSNYLRDANNKKDYLANKFNKQISSTSFSTISQNNFQDNRAIYDLVACYKLFHETENYLSGSSARDFLNSFEKIRVISLMKNNYFGASKNILEKIEKDIFNAQNNLELILLQEVFAEKIGNNTKTYIDEISKTIDIKILEKIKNLIKNIDNQKYFAKEVIEVFNQLTISQEQQKRQSKNHKQNQEQQNQENLEAKEGENFQQEISKQNQVKQESAEQEQNLSEQFQKDEIENQGENNEITQDIKSLKLSQEISKQEVNFSSNQKYEIDKIQFSNPYKIFSSKYDEIVFPQKLTNKEDLLKLRFQLDIHLAKISKISNKVTTKLKRKLLARKDDTTNFDQNEGILDRKKLVNLVLNEQMPNIWINKKNNQYQETALTILLDNSGSMRGRPIIMSALACEMIVEILEKFQIKTEIIGFTTADWKGGRVKKIWEIEGKPRNPGRLNELRHIIYKSFNQSFKKSKINLGLMLKEGLLKENIDGEALLFARARLLKQSQKRKIIMVISDGTPVDDSTALANDEDILSHHLRRVITNIEKEKKIEITAIGIGHIVGDFYKNSITIKSLDELGDVMIEKLFELF